MRKYLKESEYVQEYWRILDESIDADEVCDRFKEMTRVILDEEYRNQVKSNVTTEWYEIKYLSIFDFEFEYHNERFQTNTMSLIINRFGFTYKDGIILVNKDKCNGKESWYDFSSDSKRIPEFEMLIPNIGDTKYYNNPEMDIRLKLNKFKAQSAGSKLIRHNMCQNVYRIITKAGFIFNLNTDYWEYQKAARDIIGTHITEYYKKILVEPDILAKIDALGWTIMWPKDNLVEMVDLYMNEVNEDVIFFIRDSNWARIENSKDDKELVCITGSLTQRKIGRINLDEKSHIDNLEANTSVLLGQIRRR